MSRRRRCPRRPGPRCDAEASGDLGRPHRSRPGAAFQLRRPCLFGPAGRYAGLGAARQRRAPARALVQVPSAARHPGGRRRGAERAGDACAATRRAARPIFAPPRSSSTTACRRTARTAGRASRSMSARSTTCSRRCFPAGFYYKTFMWPRRAWQALYEPHIRAAAGLGRAPEHADPDRYAQRYAHCDVLVVGAGPSGLAAAQAAADSGARVILCDEQAQLGGSLLSEPADEPNPALAGESAATWLAHSLDALRRNSRVTLLPRTTAFGYFAHNLVALNQRLSDHLANPAAGAGARALLAGACARGGACHRRDRASAGVSGQRPARHHAGDGGPQLPQSLRRARGHARGADHGLRRGVSGGARAAPGGGCNRDGRRCAFARGRRVAGGGAARRSSGADANHGARHARAAARQRGAAGAAGCAATRDRRRSDTRLRPAADVGRLHPERASVLAVARQAAWDDTVQSFIPAQAAERVRSAGACRGVFSVAAARADGAAAGAAAARDAGFAGNAAASTPGPERDGAMAGYAGALPQPPGSSGSKAFVDWQNDVTTRDLALATREGFVRSSTSSATPPPAWPPIRARPPT